MYLHQNKEPSSRSTSFGPLAEEELNKSNSSNNINNDEDTLLKYLWNNNDI